MRLEDTVLTSLYNYKRHVLITGPTTQYNNVNTSNVAGPILSVR